MNENNKETSSKDWYNLMLEMDLEHEKNAYLTDLDVEEEQQEQEEEDLPL